VYLHVEHRPQVPVLPESAVMKSVDAAKLLLQELKRRPVKREDVSLTPSIFQTIRMHGTVNRYHVRFPNGSRWAFDGYLKQYVVSAPIGARREMELTIVPTGPFPKILPTFPFFGVSNAKLQIDGYEGTLSITEFIPGVISYNTISIGAGQYVRGIGRMDDIMIRGIL